MLRAARPLTSPRLACLVEQLPGTRQTFERFGATPVSARSLYRSLADGEAALLFPGGAAGTPL